MAERTLLYIGTYTERMDFGGGQVMQGKGEGICLYEMDMGTGALRLRGVRDNIMNPSYLALARDRRTLCAVSELRTYEGQASGCVSAFAVDADTGALTRRNAQPTGGEDPCHVALDASCSRIYVTNYTGGSVAVFPLRADGSLGEASQLIRHAGSGPHPARQEGPHPHSVTLDPEEHMAVVCDLGLDRVIAYPILSDTTTPLDRDGARSLALRPGAGPRHCAFAGGGRFLYVIDELDSTVTTVAYASWLEGGDADLRTVSTLPDGVPGAASTCADIRVTPDGRFLYGSNRGHDSLAAYRRDPMTGSLMAVGCFPSGGRTPRSFAIDPSGAFLVAANQDTDNLCVFRIDGRTGRLEQVQDVASPTPVCVTFCRLG